MKAELGKRAAQGKAWLFDAAFPFWLEKGVDRQRGGFIDLVEIDGRPVPDSPKRTFVQGRQAYAYTIAGQLGWPGPWRDAVEMGFGTIERHCRHPQGGFIHRLGPDNTPQERGRDLYDQAFIAFAKATAAPVLGKPALVDEARAVFDELDRNWSRPPLGYWEGEVPDASCRRQNPHMHLLEAAVAICSAGGGKPDDLRRAERLGQWFANHFFDKKRGFLPEYFTQDWVAIEDPKIFAIEPGHHFEWSWLLRGLERALGTQAFTEVINQLWRYGRTHGIDKKRNVAIDELKADGSPKSSRARLWPQTERIKAAVTQAEAAPTDANLGEIVAAFDGLQAYLQVPAAGAFYDKMLPDGGFLAEPARSSSLYHIVCAYAELFRFADQLGR